MTKRTIRVGMLILALAGVACGEEPAEPVAPTPAPEPAAPEPAPAPEPEPPVAASAETVPVAEDFEVEMSASVTADNYRAELDAVIAELDAP